MNKKKKGKARIRIAQNGLAVITLRYYIPSSHTPRHVKCLILGTFSSPKPGSLGKPKISHLRMTILILAWLLWLFYISFFRFFPAISKYRNKPWTSLPGCAVVESASAEFQRHHSPCHHRSIIQCAVPVAAEISGKSSSDLPPSSVLV